MSTDLDHLLRDAGHTAAPPDADALWARGRRRRLVRRAAGATSAVAASVLLVVVVANVVDVIGVGQADLAPMGQDDGDGSSGDALPPAEDEPTDDSAEGSGQDTATGDEEPGAADGDTSEPTNSPEPDPAAVADPCNGHLDRTMESFIEVVAPVSGQQVAGEVELVGCANVYEATVQYRLLDADGAVALDGFTTATCGSGCVGEFEERIAIPSPGAWTLQVFSESAEDGSDRELTEITVTVD